MRIISGECRGRQLKSPKGMETRPTLDRVRETIFNVLQHHGIYGKRVLDFFAGTGALGLEAISRGAESLTAIDKRTSRIIAENAKLCKCENKVNILPITIEKAKSCLVGEKYDLIFADPPYNTGYIQTTIDIIYALGLLSDVGILILEYDRKEGFLIPENWEAFKEQSFGDTRVLYVRGR